MIGQNPNFESRLISASFARGPMTQASVFSQRRTETSSAPTTSTNETFSISTSCRILKRWGSEHSVFKWNVTFPVSPMGIHQDLTHKIYLYTTYFRASPNAFVGSIL